MHIRLSLTALLLCLAAASPARADPVPVAGYDIIDATTSGFGLWFHEYTGTITPTKFIPTPSETITIADYAGGRGTLNDGILATTTDQTQLFLNGVIEGVPVNPVLTLRLAQPATVSRLTLHGGNIDLNFYPGQITGVTVQIGAQSAALATLPGGISGPLGTPVDDIVDLVGTGLETVPTDTIVLRDFVVDPITGGQMSLSEITVEGIGLTPQGDRLDFVSDETWRVTGSPGRRPLGFAQPVCLNEQSACAGPGVAYYNYPITGWDINTAEIPGAKWIWGPGVTATTAPASLVRYRFAKTFFIGRPTSADIFIQADDYAQIVVNERVVGEIGSITDIGLAGQAQSGQSFDITSFLRPGTNTIAITAQNGPYFFGSANPNADYSENPAGVVFGGSIFSVSRSSAAMDLLQSALVVVRGLTDSQFRNPHMRRVLLRKIAATLHLVDTRTFEAAADRIADDLLPKTSGCGRAAARPDANDWIVDCAAQAQLEDLLRRAAAILADPNANR
jgi:hypothetical protein